MIGQGVSGSDIAEEDDLWFLAGPLEEDDLPPGVPPSSEAAPGRDNPAGAPRGEPHFPRVPEGRDRPQAEGCRFCVR